MRQKTAKQLKRFSEKNAKNPDRRLLQQKGNTGTAMYKEGSQRDLYQKLKKAWARLPNPKNLNATLQWADS